MKKEEQKIGFNVFHWGPCVVHTKIPSEAIELFLKEAEASNEDAASTLAGVLNKEVFFRDKDKFKAFFEQYFSLYNHALGTWKDASVKKKSEPPPKYYLSKLWCNFQRPHDFNPPHSHGGALSFVIYLQIPEELKKENAAFKGLSAGPGGVTFTYGDAEINSIGHHSMFPQEGDMFIFPAWLKHWVYPFKSDCTRISVSGNIIDSVKLNQLKKNGH
jgi:uncharacterized protein (TIGR02466 family)